MDPVSSLIGSLLLGLGITLLYGAVKNRKVFGTNGIITMALTQGSITSIDKIPEAFPAFGTGGVIGKMKVREDDGAARGAARAYRGPAETSVAVEAIALVDRSLANNVGAQLELVNESSTRADLMPLAQLLAIADAKGLAVSTAIIRTYVREVTDESI